jgi:hypothetical protein
MTPGAACKTPMACLAFGGCNGDECKREPTPGARWREAGEPDPHDDRYDCTRDKLPGGRWFTDDELANAVYLDPTIMLLTAAKERIRWLSRRVARLEHELNLGFDRDVGAY